MHFSIIYSVDVPRDTSIIQFLPRKRRHFEMTEGDEQYDYGYLEGSWTKGKHRKLCAVLNRQQFEDFLFETGLFPEDVETMGSIGAPGLGFGLSPAISFRNDDPEAIQSAYVTPLPLWNWKQEDSESFDERDWQRIRNTVIRTYDC
jgi:hypothetical protein